MKTLRLPALLSMALTAGYVISGFAAVIEFDQKAILYNTNYQRGVNRVGGTTLAGATPRQFQGAIVYGAVTYQRLHPAALNSGGFNNQLEILDWPRSQNPNDTVRVAIRLQAGAPYMSKQVSFLFGSVILPPDTDEDGNPLSAQERLNYWRPEPFSTTGHANTGYYWSPHAAKVFAVQAGPLAITWRKAEGVANPALAGNPDYDDVGGLYYRHFTKSYIVSGNAFKRPRTIFWTEGVFKSIGRKVEVPSGRVKELKFVFNNAFPPGVTTNDIVKPYNDPITPESTNTVWLQAGRFISAYNREGRLFIELLGDGVSGEIRQHLGYEILDVRREAIAERLTTELGERLPAFENNSPPDTELTPAPMDQTRAAVFSYRHTVGGSGRTELYAIRKTLNTSDLQVYWLENGEQGIQWPFRLVQYQLIWPDDITKYSHYVRAAVATREEAKETAVAFSTANVPKIEFQDLDAQGVERGGLTDDFRFYTFLDQTIPAHRTLLRFISGQNVQFERVFSWLDTNLRSGNFTGTIATQLSTWDTNSLALNIPDDIATKAPRVVNQDVWVGQRIEAPTGEARTTGDSEYLAGFIHREAGTGYSVTAYKDPFVAGFEEAALGAIIPVNARNDDATLEVWWFRPNQPKLTEGFRTIYWPSTIGHYTVRWPTDPPAAHEIVLASNDGSGPLTSLEAKGGIYYQNNAALDGYNPNEEHALMQGGQIYALRDDLNQIDPEKPEDYSSHPYVLLQYGDENGRPKMSVFQVLREKGDIKFDYSVLAGTILQAPMPLPLMALPLGPQFPGGAPRSLNTEIPSWTVLGMNTTEKTFTIFPPDFIGQPTHVTYTELELNTDFPHRFSTGDKLVIERTGSQNLDTRWFYPTALSASPRRVTGVLATSGDSYAVTFGESDPLFADEETRYLYHFNRTVPASEGDAVLLRVNTPQGARNFAIGVVGAPSASSIVVNIPAELLPYRDSAIEVVIPLQRTIAANAFVGWDVGFEANTVIKQYQAFTKQDRKGNIWVYRGPHSPAFNPVFATRFYYRTLPGFYFPSLGFNEQPETGISTPYLRAWDGEAGEYVGEAVEADIDDNGVEDKNALPIRYRPAWPENPPTLYMAETLTLPKRGLPAVRGQRSVEVLYQQSQRLGNSGAGDANAVSVVLHDPTREKEFFFSDSEDAPRLDRIPDSVRTNSFHGLGFFPNLPPHLAERLFVDPNRGPHGAIVFKGQFVDESLGDDYLLLNVLSAADQQAIRDLCPDGDRKEKWDTIVSAGGLQTTTELFVANSARPGTFMASTRAILGPTDLSVINDEDVAVDSYALTAVGPGTGYVTLIEGNGEAFTPTAEPVSMHIIKVVDTLYRGELKIVKSSNPLNEKLTLQQVVDLAGQGPDQYDFEWLITAPVDGAPPPVYDNVRVTFPFDGAWTHVRHPLNGDRPNAIEFTPAARLIQDISGAVIPISSIPFEQVEASDDKLVFTLEGGVIQTLIAGNAVTVHNRGGRPYSAVVQSVASTDSVAKVTIASATATALPGTNDVLLLTERSLPGLPQSVAFRRFTVTNDTAYSQVFLSMDLDEALGAKVFIDGQPVITANLGEGDTLTVDPPTGFVPLSKVYRLDSQTLSGGIRSTESTTHMIVVEFFSNALPGAPQTFDLKLEAYQSVDRTSLPGTPWLAMNPESVSAGVRAILGARADVRSLSDNYVIMRYKARSRPGWSAWTEPQLAEGWIKRVLAGINPFNQRVTDLFNNRVNTDVSILTQAGPRWEGDVALNLDEINTFGLIEIYETVLRRGKMLSVGSGINYGPANDALLLAAGYLNDLYMMLGNEAAADAANPTIGIGTKDKTYGDISTALFSFKGQTSSLLEEELALLRGRDDFLQPGVQTRPVYNRLVWNYTRGIDSGEVIYALNYNIQENNDTGVDGVINADDARKMFPQGHGDAYGHYLTAVKEYYSLLLDTDFDWVPRTEAVTVLGKPVQVDYQDERKFAAAAAALARSGAQIFDLTWRRDYVPGEDAGWEWLAASRENSQRGTTRYWGADHWASRVMQGAYFNWAVGNAILPAVDPDPSREGIQKVDRKTVAELGELSSTAGALQTALDSADAHLTPLGLPPGGLVFDINPSKVTGADPETHFEQVFERAKIAWGNALAAFDDAKDVTRLMRSEQDSLADFQTKIAEQELAYNHRLTELYGTPYPEDIGPGKTYPTGYTGPDIFHYMYVDIAELSYGKVYDPASPMPVNIDIQAFPDENPDMLDYLRSAYNNFNFILTNVDPNYKEKVHYITYELSPHGFFGKPGSWTGKRQTPGRIQQAVSAIIQARNRAASALADMDYAKWDLDKSRQILEFRATTRDAIRDVQKDQLVSEQTFATAAFMAEVVDKILEFSADEVDGLAEVAHKTMPQSFIFGLASGGDLSSVARGLVEEAGFTVQTIYDWTRIVSSFAISGIKFADETTSRWMNFDDIEPREWDMELRAGIQDLGDRLSTIQGLVFPINATLQQYDDAKRDYRSLVAEALRIQAEREVFRQRAAAVVQGFRTRDAAFRIFRNEKLERYKTLFDLAARYSYLTAQAYDYETGLLGTDQGKAFLNRIVNARALGVIRNGEPQYAGSNTGDPGLSSVLAEMKTDWGVLKGRLGFNNEDAYGTLVSYRMENQRIIPASDGDVAWRDVLQRARSANILEDPDIKRFCLQIDRGSGLPVPGIVLEFSTVIANGQNLFGRPLAGGDHYFPPSAFATKLFGIGVAFEGYVGMDNPVPNTLIVTNVGGLSPPDPTFMGSESLAATPGIYLIPVGLDAMRSPALGDTSAIRTWAVNDVTVPLPFNIGGSDFSTRQLWQSSESLTEPLFGIRKHQEFRPVSTTLAFSSAIYSGSGQLQLSQFTNNRLIGRSAWNTRWKLVIPGHKLLSDPDEGLERFIRNVKDVKLYFVTYSYSGN